MTFQEWTASKHILPVTQIEKDAHELMEVTWNASRRNALLEASTEVATHWNDRTTMTNQYEQAQRSAVMLQAKATGGG
jgi:hypothetical protein